MTATESTTESTTEPAPRSRRDRMADTLATLRAPVTDVWVATASPDGAPHLVPLSLAWDEGRVVLSVSRSSATARNVLAAGTARLGVGPTRDVVMLDVVLERAVGVDEDTVLGAAYAAQADWDPRGDANYLFLVLRPHRVQAWREADEIVGRTLMRDGAWLERVPTGPGDRENDDEHHDDGETASDDGHEDGTR